MSSHWSSDELGQVLSYWRPGQLGQVLILEARSISLILETWWTGSSPHFGGPVNFSHIGDLVNWVKSSCWRPGQLLSFLDLVNWVKSSFWRPSQVLSYWRPGQLDLFLLMLKPWSTGSSPHIGGLSTGYWSSGQPWSNSSYIGTLINWVKIFLPILDPGSTGSSSSHIGALINWVKVHILEPWSTG